MLSRSDDVNEYDPDEIRKLLLAYPTRHSRLSQLLLDRNTSLTVDNTVTFTLDQALDRYGVYYDWLAHPADSVTYTPKDAIHIRAILPDYEELIDSMRNSHYAEVLSLNITIGEGAANVIVDKHLTVVLGVIPSAELAV